MKIFKRKLYYAHSMLKYNTPSELEETNLIIQHFPKHKFFCPNKNRPKSWVHKSGAEIMEECLNFVRKSDVIVASEFRDYIGRGVYQEVSTALSNSIPCFVIKENQILPITAIEIVDLYDWRFRYGRIITT